MTPAAVSRYFAAARALDGTAMAAVFAPEGILRDPAAPIAVEGLAALGAFYRGLLSAFESLDIREAEVVVSGRFAAARFVGKGKAQDGRTLSFEGLDVFEFDAQGRVLSLQGFWDPSVLA